MTYCFFLQSSFFQTKLHIVFTLFFSLALRDPHCLDRHPTIVPRMRTVLLDWLSEVCEVYTLHRETFYLSIDYIDRYLSTNANVVPKQQLQLIGK